MDWTQIVSSSLFRYSENILKYNMLQMCRPILSIELDAQKFVWNSLIEYLPALVSSSLSSSSSSSSLLWSTWMAWKRLMLSERESFFFVVVRFAFVTILSLNSTSSTSGSYSSFSSLLSESALRLRLTEVFPLLQLQSCV